MDDRKLGMEGHTNPGVMAGSWMIWANVRSRTVSKGFTECK